ncbi:conserved hypothetical protein [Perkinsus marinus ATCC 50983]|uniref:Carboxypeptidase n=1 Tax=Perkinsus marinus (strain ATCC 50983 / TXsc) TaxID=423536 RepID=C5KBC6_PERM5|nr:conserved hypothetical protein [Perkinsus marinus ATCC 50983]EER18452.1 conserved hypothetical protein [Perkinsus marinus ATCC 50983]|eukprot:XP_002786656.1 conserved hypothetical protein [Perkinsus marinus ATCC 50983]
MIGIIVLIVVLLADYISMGQLVIDSSKLTEDALFHPESELAEPLAAATLFEPKLTVTSMRQKDGLCDPSVAQFAGYFEARPKKSYFFWFFESRSDPENDPTVMWLTGGPGCSSQLALLGENGPCSVNKEGTGTIPNDYSWNNRSNIFWVDQPPGTGFSKGSYDHDEDGVAEDMYWFLVHLFTKHPEYNRKFYIAGESYAGHFIPAISHKIFLENRKANGFTIKLDGVAIGNGMTNPEEQYEEMMAAVPGCVEAIRKCNKDGSFACTKAFLQCNRALFSPYQEKGLNPYDMRQKCEHPPLCYDFSHIDKFLNNKKVQEELGVNTKWQECNTLVNILFNWDFMHNFHQLLSDQIESGTRVLIYVGDVDYICNWIGNKKWALNLEWQGQEQFNKQEDRDYKNASGKVAGKVRSVTLDNGGQFSFMQIREAGHMVPMDQPAVSLRMLNDFLDDKLPTQHLGSSPQIPLFEAIERQYVDTDDQPLVIDVVL